ncbi:MAG: isoprenylcysteine carboxylmethyltransferase family protein [Candidatus Binatia bacterium]
MHLNTRAHDNTSQASAHIPISAASAVLVEAPRSRWHSSAIRLGHFLFKNRDYLFPLVFVALILTTTPELPFGNPRLDHWLDLVGLVVMMLGQGCRLLAVGSVDNIRRRGRRKQIGARFLIRNGIFAHTRNPLYLGNLLIIVGLVLVADSCWWYLLVLPGFVGIYWAIVLAEEGFLSQQFGQEYVAYVQAVNRFVPTLRGLRQSLTTCMFSWRRALRKESGVLCTWLFATIVLLVWKQWTHGDVMMWTAGMPPLLLMFLFTLLSYRVVLWLRMWEKKRL